jgi:hypothetical protein
MSKEYIRLNKKCKHHDYTDSGIVEGCYFCKRSSDYSKYKKVLPEELLINQIFKEGRFIERVVKHKHKPNYKGKRSL